MILVNNFHRLPAHRNIKITYGKTFHSFSIFIFIFNSFKLESKRIFIETSVRHVTVRGEKPDIVLYFPINKN